MDQGDAEDLMQLSRASLGLGDKKKRFPKKETLHYIYSRHVNTEIAVERHPARRVSRRSSTIARTSPASSPTTRRGRATGTSSTTTTSCSSGGRCSSRPGARRSHRGTLRPHPRRRVPGHERAAGAHPARRCAGATGTSRSSATTRRASTRSAAPRTETSSTSRASFPGRRWSRSSRTIAPRSRSSTPPTR